MDVCSRQLIQDLRELLKENKPLFTHYQDEEESDRFYTISQKMKEVRHFSSSQKLVFYNKNRVDEQLRWYGVMQNTSIDIICAILLL